LDISDILNKTPLIFKEGQKARIVLELLFMCGLRPNELFTLQRKNINIEESTITLVETKTYSSRVIPIPKELSKDIKNYFNQEVEEENAFNLNPKTIAYYCRTISTHLDIKLYPYKTRHSFSHSFLKKTGNNLVALSKMLGHNSIETTQIYCDIDEKELKDVYNKAFNKKKGK
jgi:site-specific recombinase XerD